MNSSKIVVAVDESECSKIAFQSAVDIMKDGDELTLVFCVELQKPSILDPFHGPLDKVWNFEQKERAKKVEEIFTALCQEKMVKCWSYRNLEGTSCGEAICNFAENQNAKLLVIGSHGKGLIKRVLLGSVSSYCAQNAKCTVLIAKEHP